MPVLDTWDFRLFKSWFYTSSLTFAWCALSVVSVESQQLREDISAAPHILPGLRQEVPGRDHGFSQQLLPPSQSRIPAISAGACSSAAGLQHSWRLAASNGTGTGAGLLSDLHNFLARVIKTVACVWQKKSQLRAIHSLPTSALSFPGLAVCLWFILCSRDEGAMLPAQGQISPVADPL